MYQAFKRAEFLVGLFDVTDFCQEFKQEGVKLVGASENYSCVEGLGRVTSLFSRRIPPLQTGRNVNRYLLIRPVSVQKPYGNFNIE